MGRKEKEGSGREIESSEVKRERERERVYFAEVRYALAQLRSSQLGAGGAAGSRQLIDMEARTGYILGNSEHESASSFDFCVLSSVAGVRRVGLTTAQHEYRSSLLEATVEVAPVWSLSGGQQAILEADIGQALGRGDAKNGDCERGDRNRAFEINPVHNSHGSGSRCQTTGCRKIQRKQETRRERPRSRCTEAGYSHQVVSAWWKRIIFSESCVRGDKTRNIVLVGPLGPELGLTDATERNELDPLGYRRRGHPLRRFHLAAVPQLVLFSNGVSLQSHREKQPEVENK